MESAQLVSLNNLALTLEHQACPLLPVSVSDLSLYCFSYVWLHHYNWGYQRDQWFHSEPLKNQILVNNRPQISPSTSRGVLIFKTAEFFWKKYSMLSFPQQGREQCIYHIAVSEQNHIVQRFAGNSGENLMEFCLTLSRSDHCHTHNIDNATGSVDMVWLCDFCIFECLKVGCEATVEAEPININ